MIKPNAVRRVRLIHWNAAEARERAAKLRAAGYRVNGKVLGSSFIRELREVPPAAVVIDLGRLPAQGRDVGVALRYAKSTRHLPLVFVDGDPEKVARVQELLPDAVYTTWSRIRSSLKRAIANPPADPVAHGSQFSAYAGTPLVKKLGIKANSVVGLVGAPRDFEKTLGRLPAGVKLRRPARGRCDLVVWFTKSRKDLEGRIERVSALAGKGGLWIACPKRSAGLRSDLSQALVRRAGEAAGLVDYKVASFNAIWSGLRFARRKSE